MGLMSDSLVLLVCRLPTGRVTARAIRRSWLSFSDLPTRSRYSMGPRTTGGLIEWTNSSATSTLGECVTRSLPSTARPKQSRRQKSCLVLIMTRLGDLLWFACLPVLVLQSRSSGCGRAVPDWKREDPAHFSGCAKISGIQIVADVVVLCTSYQIRSLCSRIKQR